MINLSRHQRQHQPITGLDGDLRATFNDKSPLPPVTSPELSPPPSDVIPTEKPKPKPFQPANRLEADIHGEAIQAEHRRFEAERGIPLPTSRAETNALIGQTVNIHSRLPVGTEIVARKLKLLNGTYHTISEHSTTVTQITPFKANGAVFPKMTGEFPFEQSQNYFTATVHVPDTDDSTLTYQVTYKYPE
ncbi:hypothetical protein [Ferrimonas lipolytica]|uniref:Uncharacterized protein n=1 Tax=Ferrimonas lipolytica TaxID=2724191 RepID=A0A6H1UG50_9GAMM|nr:hypothetical protein [Ferrimonas lipolytica]QIZ78061.1 hypothetical protein HER31_14845 [Ferrimonas lipolytica]